MTEKIIELPFAANARKLWEQGLSVIPIHPKDKYPCELRNSGWKGLTYHAMPKWNQYSERICSEAELESWETWNCNIGVVLGRVSNLVALDLDYDVTGLHAKILAIVPPSPFKKKGEKGMTLFYRYSDAVERKLTWKKEGVTVAELLTNGQQTVLPPSVHPKGMAYHWLTPESLYDGNYGDMATLTEAHVEQIDLLFRDRVDTIKVAEINTTHYETATPELAFIKEAMDFINADDREEWVHTGMSLKETYGEDALNLWKNWSQTSEKCKPEELDKVWASFKRTGRTIGSVLYTAQRNGFVPSQNPVVPHAKTVIVAGGNLMPLLKAENAKYKEDIPAHLLNAPGMIGRTMDYILSSSIYPQPILALAASIAAVGTVMSHKVKLANYGNRTNMYVMGLAPSGAGKEHARSAVIQIFTDLDMRRLLMGVPASSAAVPKMVARAKGRGLVLWDEIGRYMEAICNEKAPTHLKQIATYLLNMYNHAEKVYIGDEYSDNAAHGGRTDIDQPCLNIYGTSVPDKLYNSLTGQDIEDGFLTRWLVFETNRLDEHMNLLRQPMIPPETLLAEYARWEREPTSVTAPTKRGNLESLHIDPKEVHFTVTANELAGNYMNLCRKKGITYHKTGHKSASALWYRAGEHMLKLSLVAHDYGEPISAEIVQWAIELVDNRTEYMIGIVSSHMASTKHEKTVKLVWNKIYQSGSRGLAMSDLFNQTKQLMPRERMDALDTLIQSNLVMKILHKTNSKPITILKDVRF